MGIENAKTGLYNDELFSLYEGKGWYVSHNFEDVEEAYSRYFGNRQKWGWCLDEAELEYRRLTIPLELML